MRLAPVLLAALLGGCFFHDHGLEHREVRAFHPGPVLSLRADLGGSAAAITVRGEDQPFAEAVAGIVTEDHDDDHDEDDDDRWDDDYEVMWLSGTGGRLELRFGRRLHELDWVDARVPHGAELDLRTGSGDVDVQRMSGAVHAFTGSGAIRAETSGEVVLETGSGDVSSTGGAGSIETGSGRVDHRVVPGASGELRIETGSGGVTVFLPRGLGVDLVASTGSGGVTVRAGGESVERDGEVSLALDGGGSLRLEIRTGSGHVTVVD